MSDLTSNQTSNTTFNTKKYLWYFTFVTAAAYPYLLQMFAASMKQGGVGYIFAAVSMLLCLSISIMAIFTASNISNQNEDSGNWKRLILLLLAATPPFYIVTLQLSGYFGIASFHKMIWISSIVISCLYLSFPKNTAPKHVKSWMPYKLVKKIHLISASLLIIGFILLHIANHVFALHSFELHETVRTTINLWYQSTLVEPILFLLLFMMMATGLPMIIRYLGTILTLQRSIQMGSGMFLVFFFIAHVNAVLSARSQNVETDWIFATGEQGLLASSGILIPYYILSVMMMFAHLSVGIKSIYLSKTKEKDTAEVLFSRLMVVTLIITVILTAAILGLQF